MKRALRRDPGPYANRIRNGNSFRNTGRGGASRRKRPSINDQENTVRWRRENFTLERPSLSLSLFFLFQNGVHGVQWNSACVCKVNAALPATVIVWEEDAVEATREAATLRSKDIEGTRARRMRH